MVTDEPDEQAPGRDAIPVQRLQICHGGESPTEHTLKQI